MVAPMSRFPPTSVTGRPPPLSCHASSSPSCHATSQPPNLGSDPSLSLPPARVGAIRLSVSMHGRRCRRTSLFCVSRRHTLRPLMPPRHRPPHSPPSAPAHVHASHVGMSPFVSLAASPSRCRRPQRTAHPRSPPQVAVAAALSRASRRTTDPSSAVSRCVIRNPDGARVTSGN